MSPYATIALLALVLSVAAQDNVQRTKVDTNVNWNKQTNTGVGNVNVNGRSTPFTVSISGNSNQQPTFTIQSQNPAGKTTTVKIIPIKPITSPMPPQSHQAEAPKPVHHEVPVPVPSAAPVPVTHATQSVAAKPPVFTVRTETYTATSTEPSKPTVTVRSQTISHSNDPNKPVTVTVISMAKPVNEPARTEPAFRHPTPNSAPSAAGAPWEPIPTNAPMPPPPQPLVDCNMREMRHHEECRGRHHEEKKRKGCNKRLWIKGCILGLAAFGALAFLALCCRICKGRSCCCRRHRDCERNPAYGIPAPVPMQPVGQNQVFVVQAQPVNDPYFQPTPTHTNRSNQPFVQLNETHPDVSANYVIGYPQPNEQPIYLVPQRN